MIRVLHYGLSSNLGGIETYVWNLARTIDRETYRFDFLHSDTGRAPALSAEFAALGSRFHGVTPRRASVTRNRRELAELLIPERFDVLHFHAISASYLEPVIAAVRVGLTTVVHSHGSGTSRSLITQILHRVNSRLTPWRQVARVAVSDQAGSWMFGQRSTFEVIPNGVAVDSFRFDPMAREETRRSLALDPKDLVIGHVGAFLPAKNQEFSLEVLREMLKSLPTATLLLVGSGPLEDKVRARASDLDLADRVRFLGTRHDVPKLMSAMDALLLPSRYEGLPLVALEAQAAGLPCLVSEAVPPSVLVLPTARRIPLTSGPGAWAFAVPTEFASSREAGAQVVAGAGFSVEVNTARVEDLYARVTQR